MTDFDELRDNRLLAALSDVVLEQLSVHLVEAHCARGSTLYEAHVPLTHVYFPTSAIVSLLYTMQNGSTAQMGVVGRDGLVGIAVFMGGDTTPNKAIVHGEGNVFRLSIDRFREGINADGELHRLLLLYSQALLTQMSQTAVCNRLHSVEQQLCRWLLLSRDRSDTDELRVTHAVIAGMLGVRREAVSVATRALEEAGVLRGGRGVIRIADHRRLESRACECYEVVRRECERLLP